MNIVRWLTSHPILSVWALTIVALLLSLGGQKHSGGEDVASDKHTDVHDTEHQHVVENTTNDVSHQEAVALVTPAPVNISGMTIAANKQGQAVVPTALEPSNVVVDNTGATNAVVSETADTPLAEVAPSSTASGSDLSDNSVDDLLLMAREAYWNNGLDEAASIYQQLIQREPNVVEHKGELGNVYWRQGFPEKSASLYAEIAIPMIDSGNAERVSNMIGFIGLFHPDKARSINKHMQSTVK